MQTSKSSGQSPLLANATSEPPLAPTSALELTPEERALSRVHWQALMFASCATQLQEARQALKAATPPIQKAVIEAIVAAWREKRQPVPEQNPFDSPVE